MSSNVTGDLMRRCDSIGFAWTGLSICRICATIFRSQAGSPTAALDSPARFFLPAGPKGDLRSSPRPSTWPDTVSRFRPTELMDCGQPWNAILERAVLTAVSVTTHSKQPRAASDLSFGHAKQDSPCPKEPYHQVRAYA